MYRRQEVMYQRNMPSEVRLNFILFIYFFKFIYLFIFCNKPVPNDQHQVITPILGPKIGYNGIPYEKKWESWTLDPLGIRCSMFSATQQVYSPSSPCLTSNLLAPPTNNCGF